MTRFSKQLAVLAVVAIGGLGACAQQGPSTSGASTPAATNAAGTSPATAMVWNKPDITQAQAQIDASECRRLAYGRSAPETTSAPAGTGITAPDMGPAISAAANPQPVFERCLTDRGYRQAAMPSR